MCDTRDLKNSGKTFLRNPCVYYTPFLNCFNPFTPGSDQKGISSYVIDTSLSEKVTRRDKNTIYEILFDVRPTSLRENFEKCMVDCLECEYFSF